MKQLTVKVLKSVLNNAQLPDDTVIYIGDDEELNGVHQAFFLQTVEKNELNEMGCGNDYKKGGLLIS